LEKQKPLKTIQVLDRLFADFSEPRTIRLEVEKNVWLLRMDGTTHHMVYRTTRDAVYLQVLDTAGEFGPRDAPLISVECSGESIATHLHTLQVLNDARCPKLRNFFFRLDLLYRTCSDYAPGATLKPVAPEDIAAGRTIN
jgi:hypothetical protein